MNRLLFLCLAAYLALIVYAMPDVLVYLIYIHEVCLTFGPNNGLSPLVYPLWKLFRIEKLDHLVTALVPERKKLAYTMSIAHVLNSPVSWYGTWTIIMNTIRSQLAKSVGVNDIFTRLDGGYMKVALLLALGLCFAFFAFGSFLSHGNKQLSARNELASLRTLSAVLSESDQNKKELKNALTEGLTRITKRVDDLEQRVTASMTQEIKASTKDLRAEINGLTERTYEIEASLMKLSDSFDDLTTMIKARLDAFAGELAPVLVQVTYCADYLMNFNYGDCLVACSRDLLAAFNKWTAVQQSKEHAVPHPYPMLETPVAADTSATGHGNGLVADPLSEAILDNTQKIWELINERLEYFCSKCTKFGHKGKDCLLCSVCKKRVCGPTCAAQEHPHPAAQASQSGGSATQ